MKKKSFLLFNAIILLSFEASELVAETSITEATELQDSSSSVVTETLPTTNAASSQPTPSPSGGGPIVGNASQNNASNPLPNNALYKIDKREFGVSYIIDNINYTNRINLVYKKDTLSGKGNDVNCRNIVKNNLNLSDLPIKNKNYYRDRWLCYSVIINPYIKKDSLQALGGVLNVNSKVIRPSLNLNDGLVALQKSLYPLITSQDTCKEMCGVWENDICIAKDNAGTEVNPFCSNYSAN